jgi:RHS repeat-associated protein
MQQGDLIDHVDYLPNGNIAGKSDVGQYTYGYSAYGNPYAVTTAGSYTYNYDALGRVTRRTAPNVPSGQETLTWTTFDAPSTITGLDGTQTSYEYNGLKQRVLETDPTQRKYRVGGIYQRTDDLASGNRLHSLLINAGSALIAEVQFTDDGSGTVSSANVYSVQTDKLGSTTVVRDPSGNYTARSYDAFGRPSGNSPLSSGVAFAGYNQDDDRGLLWMNNRPYDAIIGRTLTLDPIINGAMGQDGANRYAYVYNHPTAYIDPSGFDGIDFDFDFDFSFDVPQYDFQIPNMTMGSPAYTPDVIAPSMSAGDMNFSFSSAPDYSYAGAQYYGGESSNWGGAAPYSGDAYMAQVTATVMSGSYTPAAYGTGGAPSAMDPPSNTGGYSVPVPWYLNDNYWAGAQNACMVVAGACTLAATAGLAMEAAPALSMTSLATPEGITIGSSAIAGGANYISENAGEFNAMASDLEAAAADGAAGLQAVATDVQTSIQQYWPSNYGFQGAVSNVQLQAGTLLDRFGLGTGTFASPVGTPFEMRSLPQEALNAPYNIYQVLQPFNVNAGLTAPAFGQLGFGMQYQLPMSINELISQGYLGIAQ